MGKESAAPTSPQVVCYQVSVRGNYYASDGKNRILKGYGPVTFTVPEYVEIPNGKVKKEKVVNGKKSFEIIQTFKKTAITTENVALYIVQRKLLPAWLVAEKPDCVSFRTCSIIPGGLKRVIKPVSEVANLKKDIKDMVMPELKAYAKAEELSIDPTMFGTLQEAREAVQVEKDLKDMGATSEPLKDQVDDIEDGIQTPDPEDLAADLM